ncbi:MAG: hypothetical protein L0154_02400 [Chloroflexi bacterium]|nr:hypothetical protein [Chloroflexota bacterium]
MTSQNAIDVLKLHENQLLKELGTADWLVAVPDETPPITITAQWRHTMQDYAGKQFVRWVMEGVDHVHTNDYDPPWDHSGSLRRISTDPLILLARHHSLSEWAENEYTGHSDATFMSGMGLRWITYDEDIRDYIERQLYELFNIHCANAWNLESVDDLFDDDRWVFGDTTYVVSSLSYAVLEENLQLSTAEAWQQFEDDIHAENEARRKKTEQHQLMQRQVRQFWELYFPDLMDIRIEMPLFREMGLEERIAEVLADADPAIVRMMAEVYIPGMYSNSVRERIKDIVKRANM